MVEKVEPNTSDDTQSCKNIFMPGVGVFSLEDAKSAMLEEDIGGVYVGKDFSFSDLEILQENLNCLRREGVEEKDLATYDDVVISRIERKLKIREALKYKKL
jgi:hypothetical protein